MLLDRFKFVFGLWSLLALLAVAEDNSVSFAVEKDRSGVPFEYSRELLEATDSYRLYTVKFPSPLESPHPANNVVPGELYMPIGADADAALPAVVSLHILNGNYELERLICSRLAQNGVVALFFKLPYYGERGGRQGRMAMASDVAAFTNGLEQGFADVGRAIDILREMPEVNPRNIGITGISLGAIQSAIVSGRDDRIGKAFLVLGGGGISDIIRNTRDARSMRALVDKLPEDDQRLVWSYLDSIDPINAGPSLAKLAERGNLRMICAEEDEVVPAESGRLLAAAAGFEDGVTWLKGMDHYSAMAHFPQLLDDLADFFSADTPATWQRPPAPPVKTPTMLLASALKDAAAFIGHTTEPQGAHMVGVELELSLDKRPIKTKLDFARGGSGKFRLSGDFPLVGKAAMGRGELPWIHGGKDTVFIGSVGANSVAGTLARLMPHEQLLRYQMTVAALSTAAMAPDVFSSYFTLTEKEAPAGQRRVVMEIQRKRKNMGSVEILFDSSDTPRTIDWKFGAIDGKAHINYWRLDSPVEDGFFEAPSGARTRDVDQGDLLRMISSVFAYVLEMTE